MPLNFNIKKYLLWILVFLLFAFFTQKIIKNFDGPVFGYGDTNNWEHTGYFLYKYLSFTPLPQIQFINDGTLFPFGSNHVFQSWSFEKDFFWMSFYHFFGNGPWLKFYTLFTFIITFFGSYFILKKFFNDTQSIITSILLTFFNFYSILKYPYHLVFSNTHWLILSILLDFLLIRNYVILKKIHFHLVLLRALTLSLGLGQELGYVVGLNLTSFLITYFFLFIYLFLDNKISLLLELKKKILENRIFSIFTISIFFIVFVFYFSLILEVRKNIYSFPSKEIPEGVWWSNPLRIFLPFFPNIIRSNDFLESFFKDTPDGLGTGSVGFTLLCLGILGLYHTKNKIKIFLPLLVMLFLFFLYHPKFFPILKIFPWFQYMRVSGRATLVLPAIFAIFTLGIDWTKFKSIQFQILVIIFTIISLIELNHAYKLRISIDSKIPKEFYAYMEIIKNSKGEGVLDWPFCIYGANLDTGLCPFYPQTIGSYSFTKFHEKKVIGQYYGRVHPSQVAPFNKLGLKELFLYDKNSNPLFPSQSRCFNENEWKKFEEFYYKYDFSGINLYTDTIGEKCKLEFYKKFGNPIARVKIPYSGNLEFIPKK
ncbi:MAG: hypothetical protein L6Q54_03445 [Leptospiraceae bacterium]|nr:hypothetical protein [Leptospiraceae bacterium]MCK6380292.1 hypothetical protein [Leptospiraceae bacterium]NUM41103.1 hypothetical protein [Leptospiraceae bacterium]